MTYTAGQIPKVANVPNAGMAKVQNSTGAGAMGSDTNGVVAYTADATYGGRVMTLTAVTDDTTTVNVFVYILRSSVVVPIGLVNVPLSSGNTLVAQANVDFLDGVNIKGLPMDSSGKRYIPMKGGDVLKVSVLAAVTSGKFCYVQAMGADYQA